MLGGSGTQVSTSLFESFVVSVTRPLSAILCLTMCWFSHLGDLVPVVDTVLYFKIYFHGSGSQ